MVFWEGNTFISSRHFIHKHGDVKIDYQIMPFPLVSGGLHKLIFQEYIFSCLFFLLHSLNHNPCLNNTFTKLYLRFWTYCMAASPSYVLTLQIDTCVWNEGVNFVGCEKWPLFIIVRHAPRVNANMSRSSLWVHNCRRLLY